MSDMKWSTAIAEVELDEVVVRGHRLSELVGQISYTEMAFLLVRGSLPTDPEKSMLDAILVSLADHGISPTTIVARTLVSCGTPIQASIAGASLSIADWHGGSGEEVGRILTEVRSQAEGDNVASACSAWVAAERSARRQIPGFGHPQHKDGDPRGRRLLELAASLGVAGQYCRILDELGTCVAEATDRESLRRPNITGALAAILLDLQFPWQSIRGVVITARSIGLTAHVVEELEQGNKWRHAAAEDVEYTGARPV